jgi:hypothetical protein
MATRRPIATAQKKNPWLNQVALKKCTLPQQDLPVELRLTAGSSQRSEN